MYAPSETLCAHVQSQLTCGAKKAHPTVGQHVACCKKLQACACVSRTTNRGDAVTVLGAIVGAVASLRRYGVLSCEVVTFRA